MRAEIRVLVEGDWEAVRRIYVAGMATGLATFETEVPSWERWNHAHLPAPRLAAIVTEDLVGWAALGPVSARSVYAGVAEVSVYVASDWQGKGVGGALLQISGQ